MQKLTPANYSADRLYPRVAKAVAELLASGLPVPTPAVFLRMGMLSEANLKAWREGTVPYLERVIVGSVGKTNRVVRMVSLYAHDLNLPPAPPHSAGPIKHNGKALRFCKTGERHVEEAYRRVFGPRLPGWKPVPTPEERRTHGRSPVVEEGEDGVVSLIRHAVNRKNPRD